MDSSLSRPKTFRVENISPSTTAQELKERFYTEDQPFLQVKSIVPAVDSINDDEECTATITFQAPSESVQSPRTNLSVDSDFHGFTPLFQPKETIFAE